MNILAVDFEWGHFVAVILIQEYGLNLETQIIYQNHSYFLISFWFVELQIVIILIIHY